MGLHTDAWSDGVCVGRHGGYARGELWPITGVLGDFTWGFKGPEVPVFDFTFKGLLGNYTDVAVPSITYPFNGQNALKSVNVALSLFGVTQVAVREATLKLGRTLQPRLDVMTSGHLGFARSAARRPSKSSSKPPRSRRRTFMRRGRRAERRLVARHQPGDAVQPLQVLGLGAQIMSPPSSRTTARSRSRVTLSSCPSRSRTNDDLTITTD
jgi:hypothetical protein